MTEQDFLEIEQRIGYTFRNRSLLKQAFTRSSYVNELAQGRTPADTQSNEVLEFFGDSVLSAILAYLLLERYARLDETGLRTELGEADFSIIKSNMSDKRALAAAIRRLGVNRFMRLSRGDRNQNVLQQDSPNEDLFESIVAAVALDSGMDFNTLVEVVKRLDDVERLFTTIRHDGNSVEKNPKSTLKEYCEKRKIGYTYEITGTEGPEHAKTFFCRLTVEGHPPVEGSGSSRAKAEACAAGKMLEHMEEKQRGKN